MICACGHGRGHHVGRDALCTAGTCDCPHFQTGNSVTRYALRVSRNASPRSEPTHTESPVAPLPSPRLEAAGTSTPTDDQFLDSRNQAATSSTTPCKRCGKCGETKPLAEFYADKKASDGHRWWCKRCDNAAPKPQTLTRIIRNRARQRATAELIRAHAHEFRTLVERHRVEVAREARELGALPAAQAVYGASEPVRLRSGRRNRGEIAADRIDVARCPDCIKHHDRGHVCESCGAAPTHLTRADAS